MINLLNVDDTKTMTKLLSNRGIILLSTDSNVEVYLVRGISNIYDGAVCETSLTFSQKSFIIDAWQGAKCGALRDWYHLYIALVPLRWYHLYNFENVKNIHERVLILLKLQALACNFTKINTPPWVFLAFYKLYKWYQMAQRITNTLLKWDKWFYCLVGEYMTNHQKRQQNNIK